MSRYVLAQRATLAFQIDRRNFHPLVPEFMTDLLPDVSVGEPL